jgi:beta-glucosidase
LQKPKEVLVNFSKSKLLIPGEIQTLSFEIKAIDLTSFDETISSWVAEAGNYSLLAGSSSLKIHGKSSFNLASELVVETVSKALTPLNTFNTFKQKK